MSYGFVHVIGPHLELREILGDADGTGTSLEHVIENLGIRRIDPDFAPEVFSDSELTTLNVGVVKLFDGEQLSMRLPHVLVVSSLEESGAYCIFSAWLGGKEVKCEDRSWEDLLTDCGLPPDCEFGDEPDWMAENFLWEHLAQLRSDYLRQRGLVNRCDVALFSALRDVTRNNVEVAIASQDLRKNNRKFRDANGHSALTLAALNCPRLVPQLLDAGWDWMDRNVLDHGMPVGAYLAVGRCDAGSKNAGSTELLHERMRNERGIALDALIGRNGKALQLRTWEGLDAFQLCLEGPTGSDSIEDWADDSCLQAFWSLLTADRRSSTAPVLDSIVSLCRESGCPSSWKRGINALLVHQETASCPSRRTAGNQAMLEVLNCPDSGEENFHDDSQWYQLLCYLAERLDPVLFREIYAIDQTKQSRIYSPISLQAWLESSLHKGGGMQDEGSRDCAVGLCEAILEHGAPANAIARHEWYNLGNPVAFMAVEACNSIVFSSFLRHGFSLSRLGDEVGVEDLARMVNQQIGSLVQATPEDTEEAIAIVQMLLKAGLDPLQLDENDECSIDALLESSDYGPEEHVENIFLCFLGRIVHNRNAYLNSDGSMKEWGILHQAAFLGSRAAVDQVLREWPLAASPNKILKSVVQVAAKRGQLDSPSPLARYSAFIEHFEAAIRAFR